MNHENGVSQRSSPLRLVLVPGMQCDPDETVGELAELLRSSTRDVEVHTRLPFVPGGVEAADVLLDGVTGPVVLIGHSLGGTVALQTARHVPDRIFGLVTICTNAKRPTPSQLETWTSVLRSIVTQPTEPRLSNKVGDLFGAVPDDDDGRMRWQALRDRWESGATAMAPTALVGQLAIQIGRDDELAGLRRRSCPVLAIGASRDALVPVQCSRDIANAAPDGSSVVIEDEPHMVTMTRPVAVANAIVRWIDQNFPTTIQSEQEI